MTGKNPAVAATYREPTVGARSSVPNNQLITVGEDRSVCETKSSRYLLVSPRLPHGGQDYANEQDYNGHRRSTLYFINCSAHFGRVEPRGGSNFKS